MTTSQPTRRFTIQEAADYLGVTKSWMYKQSSLGRITFYWLGSRKVCTEADLLKLEGDQRARAQHRKDQAPGQISYPKVEASYQPLQIDDEISALVYGKR